MPTYEYACRSCGEHLEAVQSFSDPPLTKCPRCGGELRKVFGNIGIVFKGSGFYKTDNRSSSRNGSVAKEHTEHAAKSDHSSNGSSAGADTTSTPASTKETSSGSTSSEPAKAAPAKSTTVGAA
jgi:putative FmdB family regulatory protein